MPRRLEQEQQKSGRKQASAPAGVVNLLETELFTVGVGGGRYPVEISADIVPEGQEEAFARYLAEKEPPAPRWCGAGRRRRQRVWTRTVKLGATD